MVIHIDHALLYSPWTTSDSERVENEELLDEVAHDGDSDNCECGAGEDNRKQEGH